MMEGYVSLNDRLFPVGEARISPFDRGFLYGDGLFETLRLEGGSIRFLDRHLRRLYDSAEVIGLGMPERKRVEEGLRNVIDANEWTDARIRITLSRGAEGADRPTLLIHGRPLLHNELYSKPVDVTLHSYVREPSPFPVRLKSLNYLTEIVALDRVRAVGFDEGIFLTEEGWVAEGSISNIFCLYQGRLLTPPVQLGILPGITREVVLELARRHHLPLFEERFPLQTLMEAEEIFLTNAVREIIPVRSIRGTEPEGGGPGKMTEYVVELMRGIVE